MPPPPGLEQIPYDEQSFKSFFARHGLEDIMQVLANFGLHSWWDMQHLSLEDYHAISALLTAAGFDPGYIAAFRVAYRQAGVQVADPFCQSFRYH